jgi:DNA-directed RNA polymerase specialized sigma24 family protein
MMLLDASLWSEFLAGSKQAFERIFLAHYDELFRYGVRLTGDEEVVKDCIQNLFQRLWQRRKVLGPVEEIRPYLFTALRHHITDEARAQKRRTALQSGYLGDAPVEHSPEEFLIAQQQPAPRSLVSQIFRRLRLRPHCRDYGPQPAVGAQPGASSHQAAAPSTATPASSAPEWIISGFFTFVKFCK